MKLLTLNTHSIAEENYHEKLSVFVSVIADIMPDIIALQEVNQTITENAVSEKLDGYVSCIDGVVIRDDNHIYQAVKKLLKHGAEYYWTWLPLKKGYNKYDEGIAIMSRSKILETKVLKISGTDNYNNWKTRKILGIRTETEADEWFFSVHYGWWNDEEEPFQLQWKRTDGYMKKYGRVWLMGDFNNPAEVRGEGYDMVKKDGWHDSYMLAREKDNGITVERVIDGWKDKINGTDGMRIDQIWCNKRTEVALSKVVFNGVNNPVVSDHYGVIIEYERNKL